MDFIPLVTDDFRIAFCLATNSLCTDVQRIIWEKVIYEDINFVIPPTPQKCRIRYSKVSGSSLPHNLLKKLT